MIILMHLSRLNVYVNALISQLTLHKPDSYDKKAIKHALMWGMIIPSKKLRQNYVLCCVTSVLVQAIDDFLFCVDEFDECRSSFYWLNIISALVQSGKKTMRSVR